MPIHTILVDDDTAATLATAAQDSTLTVLEFEAWILTDWARNWRVKDDARRQFTAAFEAMKEATHG
jgi:hypothetical protein